MKRNFVILLSALFLSASTSYGQFFEDWDDGAGADRWSAPITALEDPGISFDGSVDYAFDYSSIGAPSAPNSTGGTTIGVAMETNITDQCPDDPNCTDADEGEGVGIVPLSALGQIPDSDFKLTTDAYMFWNFESGSTEYLSIGVFSQGTAVPLRFNLDNGDGLAWQFDGEGGSGTDILRFEGPDGSETGLGGWEDFDCDPDFTFNIGEPGTCYPGNQTPGPANQWVEVAVESVGGMVTLSVDGLVLDTFDNTAGAFSGGSLMIGQSDPFNSVNPDDALGNSNLVVFDNISLTVVPEPSAGLLSLVGLLALLAVRRK